jgi:hypothetical protein
LHSDGELINYKRDVLGIEVANSISSLRAIRATG